VSDVFEEVEEGLRQDKATILWEKYGWILYAIGAVIVAIVAYLEFSSAQQSQAQVENVEVLEAGRLALSEGRYSEAEALLSEVVDSGGKLAPLASHYLAQNRLEGGGDKAGAASALSAQASTDDPFAQIAVLKSAYLQADTLSVVELEEMLSDLLQAEGPASALALELIAAKAFEEGDYARARRDFAFLQVAPNAPNGVVVRAEAALAVIPAISPAAPVISPTEETTSTEDEASQ